MLAAFMFSIICDNIGLPATACRGLGKLEFILVPFPAARTIDVIFFVIVKVINDWIK
jgi:hypothetical protein